MQSRKSKIIVSWILRTEGLINTSDDIISFNLNEEKGIAEVETKNKDAARESFFSKKIDLESIKEQSVDGIDNFLDSLNCKPVESDAKMYTEKCLNS